MRGATLTEFHSLTANKKGMPRTPRLLYQCISSQTYIRAACAHPRTTVKQSSATDRLLAVAGHSITQPVIAVRIQMDHLLHSPASRSAKIAHSITSAYLPNNAAVTGAEHRSARHRYGGLLTEAVAANRSDDAATSSVTADGRRCLTAQIPRTVRAVPPPAPPVRDEPERCPGRFLVHDTDIECIFRGDSRKRQPATRTKCDSQRQISWY